jgi:hypothetical protein
MNAPSKDEEVRAVVGELDALIARLRANVEALTAVLNPPAAPPSDPIQEVPAK